AKIRIARKSPGEKAVSVMVIGAGRVRSCGRVRQVADRSWSLPLTYDNLLDRDLQAPTLGQAPCEFPSSTVVASARERLRN
ncbi:hypothetical protein, partial [Methylobacterium isbiliense]|uniref:hypothetical protein n=1 Tax=Methylobacterium isbiliense TaxID=315478 RepID=UPI001EDCDF08